MSRGVVRIKPVLIGIPHYREVYGSVCSDDVVGTPPVAAPEEKQLQRRARELADNFLQGMDVSFVRVEEPLVVKGHADLRRLSAELTYDTDALLVESVGVTPLILRTLGGYAMSVYIYGVNGTEFWRDAARTVEYFDILYGPIKSVFFGMAISLISCYKGFRCAAGAEGVGRACTEAFVAATMAVLAIDFFSGITLNLLYEFFFGLRSL